MTSYNQGTVFYTRVYYCKIVSTVPHATPAIVTKANIENGSCRIYDRYGILLGTGSLVDKLYYLKYESVIQECVSVATGPLVKNKADLWNQRLGHLNENQLREMASQDLVKGVNIRT